MYAYLKTHQVAHIKYVKLFVSQSYPNSGINIYILASINDPVTPTNFPLSLRTLETGDSLSHSNSTKRFIDSKISVETNPTALASLTHLHYSQTPNPQIHLWYILPQSATSFLLYQGLLMIVIQGLAKVG